MTLRRDRDFLLLWSGQGVSELGTSVSIVVLPLVAVVSLHASALAVGVLSALEWLPWLLIGLPAGVWVDRSRARPVLIAADVVRLLAMSTVPIAAAAGHLVIGQLLAVAFVVGLATVLFQVAYQAYLPRTVDAAELPEANAKLQGTQAVAHVAGPGLGGLLAQLLRAPFALLVDAASYAVSAATLLAMRTPESRPASVTRRSLRHEIGEGLAFVARDPLLRVMTIAPAVSNFFFIGFEAIAVLFLVRDVHLTAGTVGVLLAIGGLGAVLGAVLARPVQRRFGSARALWGSGLVTAPFGLLTVLTGHGVRLALFAFGTVVLFGGVLIYNVTIGAFRQAYCPQRILGRVVASMRFVLFGIVPLGALAAGALAQVFGPRVALAIVLAGNVLPGVLLVASPLRTMRDLPSSPPSSPSPVTG